MCMLSQSSCEPDRHFSDISHVRVRKRIRATPCLFICRLNLGKSTLISEKIDFKTRKKSTLNSKFKVDYSEFKVDYSEINVDFSKIKVDFYKFNLGKIEFKLGKFNFKVNFSKFKVIFSEFKVDFPNIKSIFPRLKSTNNFFLNTEWLV